MGWKGMGSGSTFHVMGWDGERIDGISWNGKTVTIKMMTVRIY